jgi:UDP-2,4-diacetamido-2,4,6-trideoxy-beta-L-altropyranose hydrolase
MTTLLIRADASARIGTGHVMRCLALAEGWRRAGGPTHFVCAEITPALEARLHAGGCSWQRIAVRPGSAEDAQQTIQMAAEHSNPWVVCDGYPFGAEFQRAIKEAGLRLLLVDDYGHADHYCADFVLNQNLSARAEWYANRAPGTRLLLGPRYALLRDQFQAYRHWQRDIPAVARKVLVTLGGADPDNVTGKVIEALRDLDVELKVVVGGSSPHFIGDTSVLRDVADMPDRMAWADVVISAGGTTSYEIAFMGLPNLVMVLAENQQAVADALDAAGAAQKTAPHRVANDLRALLRDRGRRAAMSDRGRQLVDGEGVRRVIACLRAADLALRRVREEDCRLIWEWANDPEARAVSLSSEPIPWETHVKWYAARLNDPGHLFYLALNGQQRPIGQIRFEITGTEAVVSVNLAKEARGCGYGAALIVRGSEQCFADSRIHLIRAYIKPSNEASARAFARAGYTDAGNAEVRGHRVRQFILRRS